MQEAVDFLQTNSAYFIMGIISLTLVLLICTIVQARKLARLNRHRNTKLDEGRLGDILDCLADNSNAILNAQAKLDDIQLVLSQQGAVIERCIKKVGIVRFNAFADIGGEQSFSVVLLDSDSNGLALSGIYGRQDSRVYAKAIFKGQGERPLSDEEQQALAKALK